jgi:hypothetical protein
LFVKHLFTYFGWTGNQEFLMHEQTFSKEVEPLKYKALCTNNNEFQASMTH